MQARAHGLRRKAIARGIGGHLARQNLEAFRIGGQRVRLPVLFHLQAVFQVAQELVSRGQARIFGAREQALVAQPQQRDHGAAMAHPLVAPAVQTLQALCQKFDIADAAGRQLDIEAG